MTGDCHGDGLIRVSPYWPPVPMSTVACPGCGITLDLIMDGWDRIPNYHLLATGIHNHRSHPRIWRADGLDLPGRRSYRVDADQTIVCAATRDTLATMVARAQARQTDSVAQEDAA